MSLSRPQIEARFGRAAATLIAVRPNKPLRLRDVQQALDFEIDTITLVGVDGQRPTDQDPVHGHNDIAFDSSL